MSFSVDTLVVGPIEENCYVLKDEETNEGVIIDAGDNGQEILAYVKDNGIDVKLLVNTHGHWDHIGAVDVLRDALGVQLAIHREDAPMLTASEEEMAVYSVFVGKKKPAEILLEDGDVISFGKSSLKVIHTPGHTKGSVSYAIADGERKAVFTGDCLFHGSIGRSDFPGGDHKELLDSIGNQLFTLDGDYEVYPGHMGATTLQFEREHNPFMRHWGKDK